MTDANASPEMILDAKERILNLRRVLRSPNLGDRERDLLDRHILADEPISLPDWAESVGVTRQRGHQIKVSALAKIRQLLEDLDNAEMQRRRNAFRSKRLAAKISIQETIGRQLCAFDAFMLSDIRRNWHKRGFDLSECPRLTRFELVSLAYPPDRYRTTELGERVYEFLAGYSRGGCPVYRPSYMLWSMNEFSKNRVEYARFADLARAADAKLGLTGQ